MDATEAIVSVPSPQFTVALKSDTSKLVFESVKAPSARFVPAVPSVSERLADVGVMVAATAGTPLARPRQITAAGSSQCRSRKWFILGILARSTLAGKRLAGQPVPVVLGQQGGESSHRTASPI